MALIYFTISVTRELLDREFKKLYDKYNYYIRVITQKYNN